MSLSLAGERTAQRRLYQVSTQSLQLVAMNHAFIAWAIIGAGMALVAAVIGWISQRPMAEPVASGG